MKCKECSWVEKEYKACEHPKAEELNIDWDDSLKAAFKGNTVHEKCPLKEADHAPN